MEGRLGSSLRVGEASRRHLVEVGVGWGCSLVAVVVAAVAGRSEGRSCSFCCSRRSLVDFDSFLADTLLGYCSLGYTLDSAVEVAPGSKIRMRLVAVVSNLDSAADDYNCLAIAVAEV